MKTPVYHKGEYVQVKILKECSWGPIRRSPGDVVNATIITKGRGPTGRRRFSMIDGLPSDKIFGISIPRNAEIIGYVNQPTSEYRYLDAPLKLYDKVEFGDMKYTVLKEHLSNSQGNNDQVFLKYFSTRGDVEDFANAHYKYTEGGGDWPCSKEHDYAALSRLVDALIHHIFTMDPTTIIKVRGKIVKQGDVPPKVVPPQQDLAQPDDMDEKEMEDLMMQALDALLKGTDPANLSDEVKKMMEDLAKNQQNPSPPQQQPQGGGQQQPQPRVYLVVYLDSAGLIANHFTEPVEGIQQAIEDFRADSVHGGCVITNIL